MIKIHWNYSSERRSQSHEYGYFEKILRKSEEFGISFEVILRTINYIGKPLKQNKKKKFEI